jgi:hypothetical protein
MIKLARVVARIAILAVAAALFIGLTGIWASAIESHERSERRFGRVVRRARWPQLRRLSSFAGELVIFAAIAAGGRMILRLRLTGRAAAKKSA